jgi:ATP-binding cassette subfamily F protein uup
VALEGDGVVGYFGSLAHWEAERARRMRSGQVPRESEPQARARGDLGEMSSTAQTPTRLGLGSVEPARRLTYKKKEDLKTVEARILAAEGELSRCRSAAEERAIQTNHVELQKRYEALAKAQAAVDGLYARWQELEQKRGNE